MMKLKLLILLFVLIITNNVSAQYSAVRINTLGLTTGTINAGVDITIAKKWSLDISTLYNPIAKINTMAFTAGVRYWRFETHIGAFWGLHSTTAKYNVGDKIKYYKGWLTGAGVSYGYSWMMSTRWNFSIEGGLGLFYMKDQKRTKYTPPLDDIVIYNYSRLAIAPSKLEISFSYLF